MALEVRRIRLPRAIPVDVKRGGGPPPPIEYGRYVNVVRKERGIKMNRLPEIYLHGEKVTGFYSIPDSIIVPGERRIQAVGRRPTGSRPRDFFSPLFRYIPPRTNEENIPSMMTLLRSAFFRVRFIVLRDDHRFVSRDS